VKLNNRLRWRRLKTRQDSKDRENKTFSYHNFGLYTGCAGFRQFNWIGRLHEQSRLQIVERKLSQWGDCPGLTPESIQVEDHLEGGPNVISTATCFIRYPFWEALVFTIISMKHSKKERVLISQSQRHGVRKCRSNTLRHNFCRTNPVRL
jgi:hypothetical protein